MELRRLWLTDFRNYSALDLELVPGRTLVVGANGQGKTNLVEAIAYLATLESFRGAPPDAMVRDGMERAVVRGEVVREGREVLVEVELPRKGRVRSQVNRQTLARARDLLEALRVSVFSADDLSLIKEGPAGRRGYMDATLVSVHPPRDQVRLEVERVLRQRNALLRQASGRLSDDVAFTLDVWDERLATAGEQLAALRRGLVGELGPRVTDAYQALSSREALVRIGYAPIWEHVGLRAALAAGRADDVRRGTSQVGPHRDDLDVELDGRPTRTHASQGEQRCLALALRLAAHGLVGERVGSPPVLVLDDVFSELDPQRSRSLVANLPAGQVVITTAGVLVPGVCPDSVVEIRGGSLREHE